jgi:hypothetical protein
MGKVSARLIIGVDFGHKYAPICMGSLFKFYDVGRSGRPL